MTSRGLSWTGAVVCLLLGLTDLVWLNLELLPAAWPPLGWPERIEQTALEDGGTSPQAGVQEEARSPVSLGPLPKSFPCEGRGKNCNNQGPATSPQSERVATGSLDGRASRTPPTRRTALNPPLRREEKRNLYFATNSSELDPAALKAAGEMLAVLQACASCFVLAEGHADRRGDPAYNLSLSEARAEATADFFERHGVPGERTRTRGYGATRPADSGDTPDALRRNRRVEIRILERAP